MKQFGIAALIVFFILIVSVHSGYAIGTAAENETHLEKQLNSVEANYSETKETNLSTEPYSVAVEYKPDNEVVRKIERGYYSVGVKSVYRFGRYLLDVSENTIRVSAKVSYRYL